jgi:hypothetical protein
MIKQEKGNKALKFGEAEKTLSLNWHTLALSLTAATLTWAATHLVPSLQEQGGILASLSGLLALVVPVLLAWLRNNQDLTVDRKIK